MYFRCNRLESVLSIAPHFTDTDGIEFTHIIFRLLLHVCSDTALRLVIQERGTQDGFRAYQHLKKRYSNVSLSTISDIEEKVHSWRWPSQSVDPNDACLQISELWDLLDQYGVVTSETKRVTFLIGKMRSSPDYRTRPHVWGGADLDDFLRVFVFTDKIKKTTFSSVIFNGKSR